MLAGGTGGSREGRWWGIGKSSRLTNPQVRQMYRLSFAFVGLDSRWIVIALH
jgi:hypothetical protein